MNSKKEQQNKNVNGEEKEEVSGQKDEETVDELKKCREGLEKIEKEKNEFLAGWQRERADFLNYKKEQLEAFDGIKKFVREDLVLKVLPVLDNIDMAIAHFPEALKEDKWVEGIIKTRDQFLAILGAEGIETIKSIGENFNPEFHEAMEQVESDKEEGKIAEEVQRGYLMNGRVIRPAKVMVSVKKTNEAS